ncbi:GNAT family N-acetyltransferase [Salininema proteolyticum]|uniref:GNAT family N-acetyltransferase n=1 Tax=Salininema proteolyticum TaxID=1607685 RepID=A0ABV8TTZ7_9ACTN
MAERYGAPLRTVAPDDHRRLRSLTGLGFAFDRKDVDWRIPTGGHRGGEADWTLKRSDEVDLDRLREWDDEMRQYVPGTRGWRWDPAEFAEELADSPPYDPALYLLAFDPDGEFAGMGRTWLNRDGARIGFVGARPRFRSRGLGGHLARRMLAELDDRGHTSAYFNIDSANAASTAMAEKMGATAVGATYELVWFAD